MTLSSREAAAPALAADADLVHADAEARVVDAPVHVAFLRLRDRGGKAALTLSSREAAAPVLAAEPTNR